MEFPKMCLKDPERGLEGQGSSVEVMGGSRQPDEGYTGPEEGTGGSVEGHEWPREGLKSRDILENPCLWASTHVRKAVFGPYLAHMMV